MITEAEKALVQIQTLISDYKDELNRYDSRNRQAPPDVQKLLQKISIVSEKVVGCIVK